MTVSAVSPVADLRALPARVHDLPAWIGLPFCRFVRLKQRNWPAKTVRRHTTQLCRRMVVMMQWLIEQGICQEWGHLSPRLIEAYIDAKLRAGWAAATINWQLIHWRTFCQFALDEGYPVPTMMTKLQELDLPRRLPRPLSDEAVRRLEECIQAAVSHAHTDHQRQVATRDRACFFLLWHCGLRISEVSELQVSDLDLSGKKLFIRASKERKDRMLYMSQTTVAALQEHLRIRKEQDARYLFHSQCGVLTAAGIRERLRKYGQQCAVAVTAHRLRHTFASQMLAAGMSITSLQRYLGHERLETTLIYAEVSDPLLQKDYYRGAATFDPASGALARQVLTFSEREELRQLIAQLKSSALTPSQRHELLEAMEGCLTEAEWG
jgi:site-specific recombinase XerD